MASLSQDQTQRFHKPLEDLDTTEQTVGCRRNTPDNCAKHSMQSVCAFVRPDGMCLTPPMSWPKQHAKLLRLRLDGKETR